MPSTIFNVPTSRPSASAHGTTRLRPRERAGSCQLQVWSFLTWPATNHGALRSRLMSQSRPVRPQGAALPGRPMPNQRSLGRRFLKFQMDELEWVSGSSGPSRTGAPDPSALSNQARLSSAASQSRRSYSTRTRAYSMVARGGPTKNPPASFGAGGFLFSSLYATDPPCARTAGSVARIRGYSNFVPGFWSLDWRSTDRHRLRGKDLPCSRSPESVAASITEGSLLLI